MAKTKKTQGKLARYVNTPEAMEKFRRHYGVPDDVYLEYRFWEDAITGEPGDLIIPVVAIIEGGVRFPMDPLLADFLDYFRISPTQISPNIFRIVNGVAELNRRLGFNLTVHDIIATYFLRTTQHEAFSLRPRDGTGISPVTGVPPKTGNQVRFCWTVEFHMEKKKHIQAHLTDPVALQAVYDSECRQVRNLAEALANPANKSPPAHDIRAMAGINLKKLLPPRPQAETSEPVLPLKRKRKGVPKGEASQAAAPIEPDTTSAASKVPEARPVMPWCRHVTVHRGCGRGDAQGMRVRTDGTVLRTGGTGSSTASALCEVARLPVDMDVWGKSTDQEVINNLRRGLMMAVQGSLEIGDRFRRQAADLENSLRVATRSVHLKTEAERMRREVEAYKEQVRIATLKKDEADLKLEDSQDLLRKALEENSNGRGEDLGFGGGDSQLGRGQLLTGGWKALYSWESDDMPPLPPQDVLPYPNAPIGVPEEELPEAQPADDDVAGPSNL
uniref:Uncharacterized protein n=1 Tax=Fagus sylvatica TaxID=28930 RepID=A0A2N9HL39_FAGSY